MASSEGDNAEEKKVSDAPHVRSDEGESCHSRDDSVKYVGTIRKGLRRGILSSLPGEMLLRITGAKIHHHPLLREDAHKDAKVKPPYSLVRTLSRDALPRIVIGEEGTLANLGAVLGSEASGVKSPTVAKKLVQAFVLSSNKKMAEKMTLDEVASQSYYAFSLSKSMSSTWRYFLCY
ncbi:sterile alpha motif (SAM) domain-containing protein [Actinidia rufa]|uniref:Sterile alpha motif (SAM) domain-containing protein n=1 Tax=Actinidia rufa TaxID=165716 RepID=A0A7J0FG89_9ERIC|nr:sterile alpha motif (SAM) domain-containing protein [Actinidia rufa]